IVIGCLSLAIDAQHLVSAGAFLQSASPRSLLEEASPSTIRPLVACENLNSRFACNDRPPPLDCPNVMLEKTRGERELGRSFQAWSGMRKSGCRCFLGIPL